MPGTTTEVLNDDIEDFRAEPPPGRDSSDIRDAPGRDDPIERTGQDQLRVRHLSRRSRTRRSGLPARMSSELCSRRDRSPGLTVETILLVIQRQMPVMVLCLGVNNSIGAI